MLTRILGTLFLLGGVLVATTTAAQADPVCHWNPDGTYVCTDGGGGGDDGDGDDGGSGGGGEPTCQLWGQFTYCAGTKACRDIPWHPPYALPQGPKPSPDSEPAIRECDLGAPGVYGPYPIEIYWTDSGQVRPPSLYEQAMTAIGEIDLGIPELQTSPSGRTLVFIPVWYWLEGGGPTGSGGSGDRTGSSAFGLVATAVLDHLEVDPGDGSAALECPWVSSAEQAEDACSYAYERASDDGSTTWNGQPAYLASVTAVWTLSFETNGTPVTIPNAPATLTSEASSAPVRVDEQGGVVTEVG